VRPWSNAALKQLLYTITKSHASAGLKEKIFNTDFDGLVIYAEDIHPPGTVLQGIMIADDRQTQYRNTIFAERGAVLTSEDQQTLTLRLLDGSIHSLKLPSHAYHTTLFAVYDVTLNLTAVLANAKEPTYKPKEMLFGELLDTLIQSQSETKEERTALIELHRRLSLPFACVVFSLIALSLGTQLGGVLRSHGFALTLGVLFTYYLLLTVGEALGKKAVLPPAIALWLPNIVLGMVGIYLFQRARQERPLFTPQAWVYKLGFKSAVSYQQRRPKPVM
jgi:lipopolysaccharide export system permease protein